MRDPVVLLVDDEVPFVETMSKRLRKRSLEVEPAFSGQEALDKLGSAKTCRFDVVILDVKMPGIDGLETLALIKEKCPRVEVIMLTGHATVDSAIEGMKLGAFDYLMKPADIDLVMAKISEACQKKQGQELKIQEAEAYRIALRRGD